MSLVCIDMNKGKAMQIYQSSQINLFMLYLPVEIRKGKVHLSSYPKIVNIVWHTYAVANEVMVDDIAFAPEVTVTKTLPLLGYGCTELEIHFLQIKHTAIGVYLDPAVVDHLQKWKGKSGKELVDNDEFFEALATAPVEAVIKVVVIKEIKASQYGTQLEGAVRDRLAAVDKYEEEEEVALEKVAEFFPTKYLKKNSYFTFTFFASGQAEITMTMEEKEQSKIRVENANVVEMIKKWYLGGSRAVSPSTIECLANHLSTHLSKWMQCNLMGVGLALFVGALDFVLFQIPVESGHYYVLVCQ